MMSFEEIGAVLGVTKDQARAEYECAVRKLRKLRFTTLYVKALLIAADEAPVRLSPGARCEAAAMPDNFSWRVWRQAHRRKGKRGEDFRTRRGVKNI